jgi:putative membrane protein
MTLRYLIATIHLLLLAIGFAAVHARWRALRSLRDAAGLQPVFQADNWYGIAALGWVATGLWRAFGGLEKGTEHYLESHWFLGKMGLFGIIFLLELLPMITLIQWRLAHRKGRSFELGRAPLLATLTFLQIPLLLLMVAMATALARGL